MPDMEKIQRNIAKMQSKGAPQAHIMGYLQSEGVNPATMGGGQPTGQPAPQASPISTVAQAVSPQAQPQAQAFGQQTIQTPYGQYRPKPTGYERVGTSEEKQQAVQTKIKEQVLAQKGKDILRSQQDLSKVENTIGTTFDQWIDNVKWNYDTYGIKPGGPISGVITKVIGKARGNPYWEGFKGSLLEFGAGLARIAMPGIRAARSIAMFQKSAPTDWSTLESGINNLAASFRNSVGTDLSRHPEDYLDVLGQDFMNLPHEKKYERKREYLSGLEDKFEIGAWKQIGSKIPELIPKNMKNRIQQGNTLEEMGLNPDEWEIQ